VPDAGVERRDQGRPPPRQPGPGRYQATQGQAGDHFWTSTEVAAFLSWIEEHADLHDLALYQLAIQTGMRRGELLGLRWSDIDWERRSLTVEQQLAQRRDGAGQFGPPKTRGSRRTIDLSDDTVAALVSWRDAQAKCREAWGELYLAQGLVFSKENGDSHDPRVISRRLSRQTAAAGVKRIRFHDLRHTSAVVGLRELGEWPDEVSKRLGHESVAFTVDTYGHLLPHRGKEVASGFDRLVRQRRAA
jgi:integrase